VAGFDAVIYPDWEALFGRWWDQAQPGMVLALDEFPAMVTAAKEIPSLLQKFIDQRGGKGVHLLLCGSSQRMMQGLVLDHSAPLYGRAVEVLKISPLPAPWIRDALPLNSSGAAVEAYAVWGGIPRYWELAGDFPDTKEAIRRLVLDPLGVLHREPERLLWEDLDEVAQAASVLSLIGQGCHRLSEIAARLDKPATSLSRPLQRLIELELVRRDTPWGTPARDAKKTLYRISDPFLRFWFRFVEPNQTQLEARQIRSVEAGIREAFLSHVGSVWEDVVRASIPQQRLLGLEWRPAATWWGTGRDGQPLELDVVAESMDGQSLLLGEVKWTIRKDANRIASALRHKATNFPLAGGRRILQALWLRGPAGRCPPALTIFTPTDVMKA
jgi:AAA+ ATPase superfamily predicted ATPase